MPVLFAFTKPPKLYQNHSDEGSPLADALRWSWEHKSHRLGAKNKGVNLGVKPKTFHRIVFITFLGFGPVFAFTFALRSKRTRINTSQDKQS